MRTSFQNYKPKSKLQQLKEIYDNNNLRQPTFKLFQVKEKWKAQCGDCISEVFNKQKEAIEHCASIALLKIKKCVPYIELKPLTLLNDMGTLLPNDFQLNPQGTNFITSDIVLYLEWNPKNKKFICGSIIPVNLGYYGVSVYTNERLLFNHLYYTKTIIGFGLDNDKRWFPDFFRDKKIIDLKKIIPKKIFNDSPSLEKVIQFYFQEYVDKSFQSSVEEIIICNTLNAYAISKLYLLWKDGKIG